MYAPTTASSVGPSSVNWAFPSCIAKPPKRIMRHRATQAGGNAGLAATLRAASLLPHRLSMALPNLKPRLLGAICSGAPKPSDVELMARISDAYSATLDQFADTDERSVVFKDFMQGLCAEVAVCMESAIGESTTVIADLRDKGNDLEKRVGDLKQQVAQSDYDDLTRVFNRSGFMRRAVRFINLARARRRLRHRLCRR